METRWRWEAHQSSIIVSTRTCCCMLLSIQLLTSETGESLADFAARCGLKVPKKVDDRSDPDLGVWEPLPKSLKRFQDDKGKWICRIAHVTKRKGSERPDVEPILSKYGFSAEHSPAAWVSRGNKLAFLSSHACRHRCGCADVDVVYYNGGIEGQRGDVLGSDHQRSQ